MNRLQARMAARAHYLEAPSLMQAFRLLDKDGSGRLDGGEVGEMFNTMCGRPVRVSSARGSYSLAEFQELVEQVDRTYPQFKVAVNLIQYLRENAPSLSDPDPLCLENCEKLLKVMDADATGSLDLRELFAMFTFMGIHAEQLIESYMDYGAVTSAEELQKLVKEMDSKYPQLNIDGKVVEFLGVAAAEGGKPDLGGVVAPPEPEAERPGARKALLVGINYIGKNGQLGGCINDVRNQMKVLIDQFDFSEENILLLTEDQNDDEKLPTKAKIQEGFAWLFDGASAGDELFFHYSGHGSQVNDGTGSESDGKNECLCPLDCMDGPWPAHVILDNEIFQVFHQGLPPGVKCVCVFDCCHSATVADLQCTKAFTLDPGDQPRWLDPPQDVLEALANLEGDGRELAREVADGSGADSSKMLWTLSGCQDNQTSADATIDGKRQGALTWAFVQALSDLGWRARYEDLLTATRKNLKGRFAQVPAMSTSTPENFRRWFLEAAP